MLSCKCHLPGESCHNYINGFRLRRGWNLYSCSYATWVVFLFPKAMMEFDCIVKHLICTLVVNNCFFILGIVTDSNSESNRTVIREDIP